MWEQRAIVAIHRTEAVARHIVVVAVAHRHIVAVVEHHLARTRRVDQTREVVAVRHIREEETRVADSSNK